MRGFLNQQQHCRNMVLKLHADAFLSPGSWTWKMRLLQVFKKADEQYMSSVGYKHQLHQRCVESIDHQDKIIFPEFPLRTVWQQSWLSDGSLADFSCSEGRWLQNLQAEFSRGQAEFSGL